MIRFPESTEFGRRIPKQRFYDNIEMPGALRRAFADQIAQVTWSNKISPSTANIAEGEDVEEIEVLSLRLNQRGLDPGVLPHMDREIPYHILFVLEHGGEAQAWIGYKEASLAGRGAFKPGAYYHTEWMDPADLDLRLDGLDMDAAYESLIRQVAGARLARSPSGEGEGIRESIARDKKMQRMMREIAALEARVRDEKQFNRQVELNGELKRLRRELEGERDVFIDK